MTDVELAQMAYRMATELAHYPDEVCVRSDSTPDYVRVRVFVSPRQMGLLVGKHGCVAQAMRTLLRAALAKSERSLSFFVYVDNAYEAS